MNHDKVKIGNVPDEFNVIIEIPANSGPVKYEVDKDSGTLVVDRFMGTAMYYPVNYGYIPHTLSQDEDPVDVLVWTPVPLISGAVIKCRPLGVLNMEDEKGVDQKLFAVPVDKLSLEYRHIKTLDDVPPHLLAVINHFFEHYKDLESGKWVKVTGWEGIEAAKTEIQDSVKRYQETTA